jgi:hypothetical protein
MGIDKRNQYDLLPGNGLGAWPIWLSDKGSASHWNAKATKP